jgi:Holliday junction resolvasome RuvABC endonuclease subunit
VLGAIIRRSPLAIEKTVFQRHGQAKHWYRCVVGNPLGRKRAARKKATKLWALGTFGLRLAEDEADAVAIATCLLRERDTEAMLERAAELHACRPCPAGTPGRGDAGERGAA